MPANFVKGDIIEEAKNGEAGKRALVFGTESGIAVAVKKQWPKLAEALAAAKALQPGEVFSWQDGDLTIHAVAIQRGSDKPKVPWIERAVRTVIERVSKDGVPRILLPRLGGDWTRVKKLLTEIGATTTIDLVVFEQFVRKHGDETAGEPADEPADEPND